MMVQGRQKSLNSLWGLPEREPRDRTPTQTADHVPAAPATRISPAKVVLTAPRTVLEELRSREGSQSPDPSPTTLVSRDGAKLVFKIAPDHLKKLADRKPPPKKVVHPFFQKKQKKASHVTEAPAVKADHVKEHVAAKPDHVIASVGPQRPVTKKPAVTSWFGVKKEKKKTTTPFPDHSLYHVIPASHVTTPHEQQRLSFQKRYSRSILAQSKVRSKKGCLNLAKINKNTFASSLHLPTRHVMSQDGILSLAHNLCGALASNPAIQSLLSRVTNLSAFDTADRETQMWVDKYRPRSRAELVGSDVHVTHIVSWLQTRLSRKTCLVKSSHVTPSSDFIVDDDAVMLENDPSLTDPLLLVLSGPTSSGKKACLTAACAELDLFIFKLNATTRRTQKELMSALQGLGGSQLVNHKQKSCIILIEDVDVLYEDEKGFWCVLEKVLEKSKVPVVVTTSDVTIEREFPPSFEGHVVWETFERDVKEDAGKPTCESGAVSCEGGAVSRDSTAPPSSPPERGVTPHVTSHVTTDILPTYLSLLCLCEGYQVSVNDTASLLSKYSRDMRKTINHLQFWCQMGVGDPLGGFNWVIPISEGEGRRVVSGDMFVGVDRDESCDPSGKARDSNSKSRDIESRPTSPDTIHTLLDKYESASVYDIYTNSFHSALSQTMASSEHSALAHDTPLGWKCLEEDTIVESDPLEWELTDMMEDLCLESRDGHVTTRDSYADRVELKNLLFDDMVYYSQVNTVSMATTRAQILPYLRSMAQADLFYQNQFEVQQAQLTGRKSRRSMAAMGISIPVTHLEWDLEAIMETKMDIEGLYDK